MGVDAGDDLPASDELKHLQTALLKCKHLEQTLRLSLVQVMLLNRKYCSPITDAVPSTVSRSLFNHNTSTSTPLLRRRSEIFNPRDEDKFQLRISSSTPLMKHQSDTHRISDDRREQCRPMQMYRSLNVIVLRSNDINVQVIKIRRHFEGVLVRVEYLVRMYCKNLRWKGTMNRIEVGGRPCALRETRSLPTLRSHQCCWSVSKGR